MSADRHVYNTDLNDRPCCNPRVQTKPNESIALSTIQHSSDKIALLGLVVCCTLSTNKLNLSYFAYYFVLSSLFCIVLYYIGLQEHCHCVVANLFP